MVCIFASVHDTRFAGATISCLNWRGGARHRFLCIGLSTGKVIMASRCIDWFQGFEMPVAGLTHQHIIITANSCTHCRALQQFNPQHIRVPHIAPAAKPRLLIPGCCSCCRGLALFLQVFSRGFDSLGIGAQSWPRLSATCGNPTLMIPTGHQSPA